MNNQFNNMIQVLTYFADQCDMFKPMLEGVAGLQQENEFLRQELDKSIIVQNRMQLNTTFSADYANFGVAVNKASAEGEAVANSSPKKEEDDLYNLIKSVIEIGKDNYDKADMEYKLDFYSMIDKLSFDRYIELWDLIETQHTSAIPPTIEDSTVTTPTPDGTLSGEDTSTQQPSVDNTVEPVSLKEEKSSSFLGKLIKK